MAACGYEGRRKTRRMAGGARREAAPQPRERARVFFMATQAWPCHPAGQGRSIPGGAGGLYGIVPGGSRLVWCIE
jgi:hypothetical protein